MHQDTPADSRYIIIGRIGSTYGVKGWLKIHAFTENWGDILGYRPWYWLDSNEWKEIALEDGKLHGKGVIAKFIGINTPEEAKRLTGKSLAMARTQLPKLDSDEYYWSDLEGLTVVDQQGLVLGKVIYLIATGTNDVLVVKGEKEHCIPYLLGKVITSIDLAKQEIHVNWEVI